MFALFIIALVMVVSGAVRLCLVLDAAHLRGAHMSTPMMVVTITSMETVATSLPR